MGAVVPGARAYRWFAVKHSSNFFRCGTETDISLTSSSTGSSAAFTFAATPLVAVVLSTFLRFCAGSSPPCSRSWTKLAISLKRAIFPGESGGWRSQFLRAMLENPNQEKTLTSGSLNALEDVGPRLEDKTKRLGVKRRAHVVNAKQRPPGAATD
jgi:hypothetical protein